MFFGMKKTFRNKQHTGWKIGNVQIHSHIHNPENWELSCRELGVSRLELCPKSYEEWQVLGMAHLAIIEQKDKLVKAYDTAIDVLGDAIMKHEK